jgi:hypothetical protein
MHDHRPGMFLSRCKKRKRRHRSYSRCIAIDCCRNDVQTRRG